MLSAHPARTHTHTHPSWNTCRCPQQPWQNSWPSPSLSSPWGTPDPREEKPSHQFCLTRGHRVLSLLQEPEGGTRGALSGRNTERKLTRAVWVRGSTGEAVNKQKSRGNTGEQSCEIEESPLRNSKRVMNSTNPCP